MKIDRLESRVLLTALTITGTSSADRISISQSGGNIIVKNTSSHDITAKLGNNPLDTIKHDSHHNTHSYSGVDSVTGDLGAGDDTFSADSSVTVKLTVAGSDGKDTITGGGGADILSGDKATGTGYNDSINGAGGNDTLYGYAGDDVLLGSDGSDSIRGGSGKDSITGGLDPDKLFGETGNDQFTLTDGSADTADGGPDSDSYDPNSTDHDSVKNMNVSSVITGTDDPDGHVFAVFAGNSNDTIAADMQASTLVVTINGRTFRYSADERMDFITNGFGEDIGEQVIFIHGGGGNDKITTSSNGILLRGEDGNDTLSASAGAHAQTFFDDAAIDGGAGKDVIQGGGGGEILVGGAGDDSITAGAGDDTIFGDGQFDATATGNDTILAGNGEDHVFAGPGNDTLDGGAGPDDLFGGDGQDLADYRTRHNAVFLSLDDVRNDGEAGEADMIESDVENLDGGSGNDVLKGNDQNNALAGKDGNDTIFGFGGKDILNLGSGRDSADGGDGNDTFTNLDGFIDTLIGGGGSDKAQKATADHDVISQIETLT